MISPGVYPAAVTPFNAKDQVDYEGLAKLLAWFEANACQGAVLAGTNGEGPSLSAVEKRDMVLKAKDLKGKLDIILGVATPSLDEAIWLCKQAANSECKAVLLMAPYYFRDAKEEGIKDWFKTVLDKSPADIIVYNFPQKTGITITKHFLEELAQHPKCIGVKDSSGNKDNLSDYRDALPEGKLLFVGNETLLFEAMNAGWTGTISGAANCIPMHLSQVVKHFNEGKKESAEEMFKVCLLAIEALRSQPQPAMNKAILNLWKVLPEPNLRLPLTPSDQAEIDKTAQLLKQKLGLA